MLLAAGLLLLHAFFFLQLWEGLYLLFQGRPACWWMVIKHKLILKISSSIVVFIVFSLSIQYFYLLFAVSMMSSIVLRPSTRHPTLVV